VLETHRERRGQVAGDVTDDPNFRRLEPQREELPREERPVQVLPVAADELRSGDDDRRAQASSQLPWTPLGLTTNVTGL
jgi:hypothetical protein